MRKALWKLVLVLPFLSINAGAQNTEAALNALASKHPTEKLYIHYDKEYYVTGETIFFKAYFYSDGKPSGISSNLYLQFADSKGGVVSTKKFPVMGAIAKGSIDIPDSLPQGNYFVRALTPIMLNDDEGFIYKKNIFVFKPGTNLNTSASLPTVSLQFFPESGDLVEGINTVLGFKATDQWGRPVEVNGTIRTEEGTTIKPFKSFHDGIGSVTLKPLAGKKYIAEVVTSAGMRNYPLPEVKNAGVNLKIEDEKGGKKFILSRSVKNKQDYAGIKLVAQINGHSVYENEISFEDYPSIIGHLVTDSIPSGILHLSLFNKDGAPLAERLCFVNNGEYIGAGSISATKIGDTKRAENSFEMNFPEAIQRSLSVSVTDASGGSFKDNDNIWSRFLLTGDLKGSVYNPSWYFEDNNDSTKQALDNLMLTHGWTRFSWTKILAGQFPEQKIKDQPLMILSGKVMDEKNKEVLGNGKLNIYLEAEDSSSQNFEAMVDANGVFRLDSILYYGNGKLFYAFTDSKAKPRPALVVLDDNPLNQEAGRISPAMFSAIINKDPLATAKPEIDTRYEYVKSRLDEYKELERVTVQSKTNKKPIDQVNEKYTSGVFRTPGKVNLDNINDPANDKAMNAVDYIKNRIQQVEIQANQFVNRKNFSLQTGKKWAVGVFVNEVPADIFQLRLLRTDDIALVKFYEAGFVGVGSSFPGGAISVYTKEQDKNEEKPDKLPFAQYRGYSISKEFYSPDYSNPELKHTSDNRTTLYWNPDVYTDNEMKSVKLNFFNNDFSKKFKVVIEGFDANGKLVHIEKIISN